MNRSTLSESFGQQIEELTSGTIYEVEPDEKDLPDKVMDREEARIRSAMYSLWMCAQAKSLALSMKSEQAAHYEQLYDFSYGVTRYDPEHFTTKGPENLALMIIGEKNSFAKRIDKLHEEYKLFHKIMDSLDKPSSKLLTRYFLHNEKVDYETLRSAMKRNLKRIEQYFNKIEQQQEEEAERLEDRYQLDQGRIPFMKGRLKVYMTNEEIQQNKRDQESKRKELWDRFGFL